MAGKFPETIYLFACPLDILKVGGREVVRIPPANEAFYWSLDPLAATTKLTEAEAEKLSVPTVSFAARLWGCSWGEKHYDVLRSFYLDKGYNPASIDVAHELGYPLFEVHSKPVVVSSQDDIQSAVKRDKRLLSTYPTRDKWCLLCEHYQSKIQALRSQTYTTTKPAPTLTRHRCIRGRIELSICISIVIIFVAIYFGTGIGTSP
ncbi:hypothetical protein C8R44DRAFT_766996 [Mycena epipterygia]|nr:hypothetical protein C8R44DRAFT_766996 [Mycena epipterygia]